MFEHTAATDNLEVLSSGSVVGLLYIAPLTTRLLLLVLHLLPCRPKSYLLVLLGLEAYQQYLATAAAHNLSTPASTATPGAYAASSFSNHDKAVAVEFIFITFLELAATLSPNTLLCWDMLFSCKVVPQVMACPDFSRILRPKGCESHPLVLDLGNPVNNVAAAVPALDRLKQLAAADLELVMEDANMQLQQQVQELQSEQKAQAAENARNTAAVAALILHQQIVCKNQPPSSGYTWKFDMPVAAWLPDGKTFTDIWHHQSGARAADRGFQCSTEE